MTRNNEQFTIGRKEEESPVEAKDVSQLHPGVVFVFSVSYKLTANCGTELVARGEFIRCAEVSQGVVGGAVGEAGSSNITRLCTRHSVLSFTPGGKREGNCKEPGGNHHLHKSSQLYVKHCNKIVCS